MSTRIPDQQLLALTSPALERPLPSALAVARADVLAAARELLAIPEPALTRPWPWKGDGEEEVRYGAYRAAEAMELAEVEARTLMAEGEASETRAARLIGPATAARWDLHGLLVPLDDAVLDADPGAGEWSLRLVMGHVIGGQRGYAWGTAWWQAQGFAVDDQALPPATPEEVFEGMPAEDGAESEGTPEEVRARLDDILDQTAERLAGLPDERSVLGARWSGFAVPIGFRFGRMASHIREHSVQVEKTLVMLGHVPTESERLVRHLLAAYGRAEATVFGRIAADAAAGRIATGAAEALDAATSARVSAGT